MQFFKSTLFVAFAVSASFIAAITGPCVTETDCHHNSNWYVHECIASESVL